MNRQNMNLYKCATRQGSRYARRMSHGFTLLEVLMASVVLSMAVAAISQAVISGQTHAYESLHRMHSAALGQALMEEVTALPYPTIEPGAPGHVAAPGSRSLYDSMDDFDGYVEATKQLKDQTGRDYDAAYQGFNRKVTVKTKTLSIAPLGDVPGLEIVVNVIDARGTSWDIVRFMPRPASEGN